jgi:hypothetical protein
LETLKTPVKKAAEREARRWLGSIHAGHGGQGLQHLAVISAVPPGPTCSTKRGDNLALNKSCKFKSSWEWGGVREERKSKLCQTIFFLHCKNSNAREVGVDRKTKQHLCLKSSEQQVRTFQPAQTIDAF